MAEISIIIPVYNVEKYLRQCLNSIKNQTFNDFEVILIDDFSTDNSYSIIEEFQSVDSRFKVIKNINKGVSQARNLGLEKSKSKYTIFLDSDDYFELNLLKELYNRAQKFDTDITVCSSRKVNDRGDIIETKNPNSPIKLAFCPLNKVFRPLDYKNIFSFLTPVPWNKLYRTSLLKNHRITYPNLTIAEDVSFFYSALISAQKVLVFDKELINYRFNRKGSMATYRGKYTIDIIESFYILKKFLTDNSLDSFIPNALETYLNHLRWEVVFANKKNYRDFLAKLKQYNDWEIFTPGLINEKINIDYLNQLIGNKKVMFYGFSLFIQKILNNKKRVNILGIIDKNKALQGKTFYGYKVFPPSILDKQKIDEVFHTIWTNYPESYPVVKLELDKYKIKLRNIFI